MNALILAVSVAAASPVKQSIPQGELQRFAYEGRYPLGCQAATLAANGLRTQPTSDPARLRGIAQTYRACATSPYGENSNALHNQADFNAAAALLLAARNEQPPAMTQDAGAAKTLAEAIVAFRRQYRVVRPGQNDLPSVYYSDAARIANDATALIDAGGSATPS